jgi:hypothetical protein
VGWAGGWDRRGVADRARARPAAGGSVITYMPRTCHSEALIVRGTGCDVDHLDQPRASPPLRARLHCTRAKIRTIIAAVAHVRMKVDTQWMTASPAARLDRKSLAGFRYHTTRPGDASLLCIWAYLAPERMFSLKIPPISKLSEPDKSKRIVLVCAGVFHHILVDPP